MYGKPEYNSCNLSNMVGVPQDEEKKLYGR